MGSFPTWHNSDGGGGYSSPPTPDSFYGSAPRKTGSSGLVSHGQGMTVTGMAAGAATGGMLPIALMGAGLIMSSYGKMKAAKDQADAERANASYYREQAAYAREVGDRKEKIFSRDTKILLGDQFSSFAKAGIDTQSSVYWMANSMVERDNEQYAIRREADMNVRLATLRAEQSDRTASDLEGAVPFEIAGGVMTGIASVL